MDCKHVVVEGNTTKYYVCKIYNKPLDENKCKNCMIKNSCLPKEFKEIFKGVQNV